LSGLKVNCVIAGEGRVDLPAIFFISVCLGQLQNIKIMMWKWVMWEKYLHDTVCSDAWIPAFYRTVLPPSSVYPSVGTVCCYSLVTLCGIVAQMSTMWIIISL
jgi:hypothetical protein